MKTNPDDFIQCFKEIETYLKEVKERVESATEGPWKVDYEVFCGMTTADVKDRAIVHSVIGENIVIAKQPDLNDREPKEAQNRDFKNANFIRHARTDIPKLVAMVEKLLYVVNCEISQKDLDNLNKIARGEE